MLYVTIRYIKLVPSAFDIHPYLCWIDIGLVNRSTKSAGPMDRG